MTNDPRITELKSRKSRINLERRAEIGNQRKIKTRTAIQSAAFDLVGNENGLFTTVEEICAASGISRGTFYNYFPTPQSVFESLAYELSHEFLISVITKIKDISSASERTSFAVRAYLEKAKDNPRWGWGMVNISSLGPIFGIETYNQARMTVLEGMESGEFTITDADIGRDICMGSAMAAMTSQLRNPETAPSTSEVAKYILIALGVEPKKAKLITEQKLPHIT